MRNGTGTLTFKEIEVEGYEKVVEVTQGEVGLHTIIVIHSSVLGPAVGGTRVYPYESREEAIDDALRLARGMTYKASIAETGTGGGKSVINVKKGQKVTRELLLAYGEAVEALEGKYICAEDMAMTAQMLNVVREKTQHIVGLDHPASSGNPSPFTSYGGFRGIQATAKKLWGTDSLVGRTVAIQGLGSVGRRLAEQLFWAGARLIVTDIDEQRVQEAVTLFGAKAVSTDEILQVECDILAPCARGGILNERTIPHLRCRAVAGLANNMLLVKEDGERLRERGILYAPDYLINGGGLLNVCVEILPDGYDPVVARAHVDRIYDLLTTIYTLSDEKKMSSDRVADEIVEYNVANGIGKRTEPVVYHH